ncbi:MAG TPA: gliding motility-associated C-terminal domain-containing protein, partial [Flavitalea sp.]|nr:gliding motility-associated C-terminal domain-containing protein [Flavitalea sp.]
KTYTVLYVVYSGTSCVNQSSTQVVIKASPSVQFDPMAAICEEADPVMIVTARETTGLAGSGIFSGLGMSAQGLFDPAVATGGSHVVRYTFLAGNGCKTFEEQSIKVYPTPAVDAGPDRTVLEGGFITLNGKGSGNNLSFLWTPATAVSDIRISNPKVSPVDDIYYKFTVTSSEGCTAQDEVFVKVLKLPKVPNAFSPNGDGINDTWNIQFLDSYPGCTVDVYNRYGQIIFHSSGYSRPWDGKFNGGSLPVGTYYWIINPKNGRSTMSGSVTLIR